MLRVFLKYISIISLYLLILHLAGCSVDNLSITQKDYSENNSLVVNCSLQIPELGSLGTRGDFSDQYGTGLKLTIFEFSLVSDNDGNCIADKSFITNIYEAKIKEETFTIEGERLVKFEFTLKAAEDPKILHLMVADDYLTCGYGSMASILPEVSVSSGKEAYWGSVEFKNGFTTTDQDNLPILLNEVEEKLSEVPMIRNFAKLSVIENLPDFKLKSFKVFNMPSAGTVVPWNQTNLEVPELLISDDNDKKIMQKYSLLDYSGIVPGIAQFDTSNAFYPIEDNGKSIASCFMYEHPYESSRRTFIIVRGEYCPDISLEESAQKWIDGYYKLDIGLRNEDGSFNNYNIIRNIHYKINIEYVRAEGLSSETEAINSAPFNNLTAATETAGMLNISDGENILSVNATTMILINNDSFDIICDYKNIKNSPENMGTLSTVNLKSGNVIDTFSESLQTDEINHTQRLVVSIKPKEPSSRVETQDFTIIDQKGLGRTVHLVLTKPFEYGIFEDDNTATIAPGIRNPGVNNFNPPQTPEPISATAGANFTLYFNLPNEMPQTMFPLNFQIESKNQIMENNKASDNMVVAMGSSLFNPSATAISYVKTVTYAEYQYLYESDSSTEVNTQTPNNTHTIRCRFMTIIPGTTSDEIRIHNDYFIPDASVKVIREN